MKINYGDTFSKEFKKLLKKYRSLDDDLQKVIRLLKETPNGDGSKHWIKLKEKEKKAIIKKRMMCRCVKGTSFRLIYYYDGETIELEFIEIYFKGKKETQDKQRIKKIWEKKAKNSIGKVQ